DIIGAYALAIGHNDNQLHCEVMTIDEIKQSWKQSKMSAVSESGMINQSTTHGKFTGEMAKRTVINRLCKRIINTSDDAELIKSVERTDEDTPEQQIIEKQIANESNKKVLDFPAITSSPAEPDSAPSNDAEKQEMKATKQQFERIIQIESDKEKLIKMMSDFAGRKIERVSELTEDEAESFILKFDQNKDLDNINDPAWG
ncbi:MAG: recombinase RecT, partial [Desulfatitalea sp.]|nr:recombinase RecT [Desulfatitalea sp.]